MPDFILELFSEEIPAKLQIKYSKILFEQIAEQFKINNIAYQHGEFHSTPARLVCHFQQVIAEIPEQIINKKGPKQTATQDIVKNFANSVGLKSEDLTITNGNYFANFVQEAKPTAEIIITIIENILISFTWPKSMRWGHYAIKWIRPLRNILALFDNKILPIKFGHLLANNLTYGHRFLGEKNLKIKQAQDYFENLSQNKVIISPEKRKEIITAAINKICSAQKLVPVIQLDLLEEVAGLVELPNVILGKFDPRFLNLPQEILINVMKNHQRYFHCLTETGAMSEYFIIVANIPDNQDIIKKGNEKVLSARFADAEFFWKIDLATTIAEFNKKLSKIIYHHKLGNIRQKADRMVLISQEIAKNFSVNIEQISKAAFLAKLDLASQTTNECPELQGIIGKYYLNAINEDPEVATAVAEHYRPYDQHDQHYFSINGAIIAIADKIDTIIGMWLAGEKPTSSKDPFAVRRAALGVIKIIRQQELDFDLLGILNFGLNCFKIDYPENTIDELSYFLQERLKNYLKTSGFRNDLLSAVMDIKHNNILKTIKLCEALTEIYHNNLSFLFAVKRSINILEQNPGEYKLIPNLMNNIELELYQHLHEINANIDTIALLKQLLKLENLINQFFDKLLINDPNNEIRNNRLSILTIFVGLTNKIANFKHIEV